MKILRVSSTVVFSLLLGFAAPALAQEPAQQEQKPEPKQEQREDQMQKKDQRKDKQPEEQAQKKDDKQTEDKPVVNEEKREVKTARIPEDHFRAHFGREHSFPVNHVTVVSGTPRFVYSGYTFVLVDPWPAGWYYSDDCYIDFIDGEYFLFDLAHPGVRMAVNVIF